MKQFFYCFPFELKMYKFAVLNMKAGDAGSIKIKREKMDFKKGDYAVYHVKSPLSKDLLYCLLSGRGRAIRKKGFKGKVMVNGLDIVEKQNPAGFTYICAPQSLPPDSKVGDFITFAARSFKIPKEQKDEIMEIHGLTGTKKKLIGKLEARERAEITLALTRMTGKKKKEIYLLYNTALGLGPGFAGRFKDLATGLKQENALVIYLSTDLTLIEGKKEGDGFMRYDRWNKWIDGELEITTIKINQKEEQQ